MVRVGCSGWQYRHWRGAFYPLGLRQASWFEHYASVFDTVELDGTFYRLPTEATVDGWRARAPAHFLFAMKASRFLTHVKRLRSPEEPLALFWSRVHPLGRKLGPVLYQLPPTLRRDDARLAAFLGALPSEGQAIEFRHPSWYVDETFRALAQSGVALCLHDMPGSEPPRQRVGPFVYVRLHGAAEPYRSGYPDRALRDWARWLRALPRSVPAFVYFNNDAEAHAPEDARRLRAMVAQRAAL
jgi:uncharacterized protein YecE (DUF72 family)